MTNIDQQDARRQFSAALDQYGLKITNLVADGRLHRCDDKDHPGKKNGAYILHLHSNYAVGGFMNWGRDSGMHKWVYKRPGPQPSAEAQREIDRAVEQEHNRLAKQVAKERAEARLKAQRLWDSAEPAPASHGYCVRKEVEPRGLRIFRFRDGDTPLLIPMIDQQSVTIELRSNIKIEVRPASFRKLRGPTYIGIICDELAFWLVEDFYQNPDIEVLAAARPGLLTTGGPLLMASSPYAKRGVLWDSFKKHYGPDGSPEILVCKGSSIDFNPTIPQEEIDAELERDRARNTAEYLAEFRSDVDNFVVLEVVEDCLGDYYEIAPALGIHYHCFVDAAGGTGQDSYTAAFAHFDKNDKKVLVDCIREWKPPFSPAQVVAEIAALAKSYRVSKVVGDHFAGGYPLDAFRQHGVIYETTKSPKSDLYRDFLPVLNSGGIVLPHSQRLVAQTVGLERQVSRGGKDSISHAPNAHDDLVNSVAGVCQLARAFGSFDTSYEWANGPRNPDGSDPGNWQALRTQLYLMSGGNFRLW